MKSIFPWGKKKKIEQAIAREVRIRYNQKVSDFNCENECKGNVKYFIVLEDGTVVRTLVNTRFLDNRESFVFMQQA